MKIEIGRYYKNRNGAIYGPVEKCKAHHYPYKANGETFTEDGRWVCEVHSKQDLIEDVTHLFEPKKPFPTWEEFREWSEIHDGCILTSLRLRTFYEYFRNRAMTRTEFPKVGDMVEGEAGKGFNGVTVKGIISKFIIDVDNDGIYECDTIRPIQPDPKQSLIERLKMLQDWHGYDGGTPCPFSPDEVDEIVNEAIKALGGKP